MHFDFTFASGADNHPFKKVPVFHGIPSLCKSRYLSIGSMNSKKISFLAASGSDNKTFIVRLG
jgi:hypothetical protein